jgi:hypothetical protein
MQASQLLVAALNIWTAMVGPEFPESIHAAKTLPLGSVAITGMVDAAAKPLSVLILVPLAAQFSPAVVKLQENGDASVLPAALLMDAASFTS